MTEVKLIKSIDEIKKEDGKTILLIYDTLFKSIFMREKEVLFKMLKAIFKLKDNYDSIVMVGYETVPTKINGKTYRGDILIRLSAKSFISVEMNRNKASSIIDRNMVNSIRIHNQILERREKDNNLKDHRMRVLNLNLMSNKTGNPFEYYAVCNTKTGEIASLIYSFCNAHIEKCKELVYTFGIESVPEEVRWCAILVEEDINKISYILGDDLLSMEEKEKFLKTIKEVNDDKLVLEEWIMEENARLKREDEMSTAYDDGLNKGIEEGIEKGIEQGIEQGIEENKIEIIKNMLNKNYNYETISEITGKSIEDIEKISDNI